MSGGGIESIVIFWVEEYRKCCYIMGGGGIESVVILCVYIPTEVCVKYGYP